jgi:glyoxylase I family protein
MSGRNEMIGGGGFHHVAVRVKDFDAAVKFYTKGLGFVEKLAWGEGDGRAIMLDTGDGSCLEVFAGGKTEPKPEAGLLHFALHTKNCDAAIQKAAAAGAVVTMQPKTVEIAAKTGTVPVRIAFCKAPGGELIEFFQSMAV